MLNIAVCIGFVCAARAIHRIVYCISSFLWKNHRVRIFSLFLSSFSFHFIWLLLICESGESMCLIYSNAKPSKHLRLCNNQLHNTYRKSRHIGYGRNIFQIVVCIIMSAMEWNMKWYELTLFAFAKLIR